MIPVEKDLVMDIQSQLTSGQLARLIPSLSDSKKEEKATSIALAAIMAVPEFTSAVLSGKRIAVLHKYQLLSKEWSLGYSHCGLETIQWKPIKGETRD